MSGTLRLLKVVVQPIFVVVEDDGLSEQPGNPVEVPGRSWREWSATALGDEDMAALQAQYDVATAPPEPPDSNDADAYA